MEARKYRGDSVNLTIEQMREIVDGAPEDCDAYETDTHVFDLDDLRAAIADHDRIDTCSDIANHISPNTRVSEAHVNEAFKLNSLG